MKTAIQELIEELELEEKFITDNDSYGDRMWRSGIRKSLKTINKYLEKEKQQIIDANYFGSIEIIKVSQPDILDMCLNDFEDAEDYYNETFKND